MALITNTTTNTTTNTKITIASILAAIVILPIIFIIFEIFTPLGENFWHLYDYLLLEYFINSLFIIFGVGVLSFIFGVGSAFITNYYNFRFKKIINILLVLPLAAPSYIIAYTWNGILSLDSGLQLFLANNFGFVIPEITNIFGVILILSLTLYPYVYLFVRVAFASQSQNLILVGKNFGFNDLKIFYKVSIPLARPAIIASIAIVIMEALADYGVSAYYGVSVFTTGIFKSWFEFGDISLSAKLSFMLLLIIFILIYIEKKSRKQAEYYNSRNKSGDIKLIKIRGFKQILATIFCLLPPTFAFIIPSIFLIEWSILSLNEINSSFFNASKNSFIVGILGVIFVICIALFFAFIKRNYPSRAGNFIISSTNFGYAMPGVVIAVGIMLLFGFLNSYISFNPYDGLYALILAYILRFLVMANNNFDSGLSKITLNIDKSGQSLGFSNLKLWIKVHLPLLSNNIIIASLIVFIEIIKELPTTLILRPFNFNTLAVRAFELASDERLADSAIYAISIIILAVIPVILMNYKLNKERDYVEN